MGDGHLVGRDLRGLHRIDVDELMVQRRVGELVDLLLGDLVPLANTVIGSDALLEDLEGSLGLARHMILLLQGWEPAV